MARGEAAEQFGGGGDHLGLAVGIEVGPAALRVGHLGGDLPEERHPLHPREALLAVEFLNTAIERLCNHVQPELHAAIRVTKDLGSAAVFFAIALAALIWIAALVARFGF